MQKLSLIKNGVFKISQEKFPTLKQDSSIVRLGHVGICSSDINRSFGGGAYDYPLVMGHEAMGYIHQSNGDFQQDDKVVIFPLKPCFRCSSCITETYQTCNNYSYYGSREDGAYQEFLNVNNWNIIKLPIGINDADAALIEPTAVMIHVKNKLINLFDNLDQLQKMRGAIIGGGFLTMIFSKILNILGLPHPDIYDRNDFKIKFANSKNIKIFNSKDLDNKKNDSYDWVIEASGDPAAFSKSIQIAKPSGKLIWMSNINDDLKISTNVLSQVLRKELIIAGSWNSSFAPSGPSDWRETINIIENGLNPSEFVSHFISLEDVPSILSKLNDHKSRVKKFNAFKAMIKF